MGQLYSEIRSVHLQFGREAALNYILGLTSEYADHESILRDAWNEISSQTKEWFPV